MFFCKYRYLIDKRRDFIDEMSFCLHERCVYAVNDYFRFTGLFFSYIQKILFPQRHYYQPFVCPHPHPLDLPNHNVE